MSEENTLRFLNYYKEVNPNWLLTGKGSMLLPETNCVEEVKSTQNPRQPYEDTKKEAIKETNETLLFNKDSKIVPLVNVSAVGGFGNNDFSIAERDIKDRYVIPKFEHKQIDFMIEVEGSSMVPKYNSGDVVACRIIHERQFIQWNKVHVIASKSQGILIKRIKKSDMKAALQMVSDNTTYDPFNVPEDDISGIALVVGVIRLE